MKRKISIIALFIITIFVITGCSNSSSSNRVESERYSYIQTDILYKVVHPVAGVESFSGELIDKDGNDVDDNKYIALLVSPDNSTYYAYGGTYQNKILYEIEDGKVVEIANVNSRFDKDNKITTSLYGDSLVYTSGLEPSTKELYIYFSNENKSYLVDENAYMDEYFIPYAISPDGRTIIYMKDYDKETGVGNIYISKNGEVGKLLYEKALPLAVSNNGQEIYYKTANNELYKNDTLLSDQPSFKRNNVQMTFNESYTEFMLLDSNADSYYYRDGELIKLEKSARIQTPSDVLNYTYNLGHAHVSVTGIDTFDKSVCMTEDGIFYIDTRGTAFHKMLDGYYEITLSRDGKKMLATTGFNFYLFEDVEKYDTYHEAVFEIADDEETSYAGTVTNDDLSKIYCRFSYSPELMDQILDEMAGTSGVEGVYKVDVKKNTFKQIDDTDRDMEEFKSLIGEE